MDTVVSESEHKGLFLNRAKTYTMVFSKSSLIPTCQSKVHGKLLDQVNSFVYLVSVFTSDSRCEKEVKRRIGIAKTSFTSMRKVLCRKSINMSVRQTGAWTNWNEDKWGHIGVLCNTPLHGSTFYVLCYTHETCYICTICYIRVICLFVHPVIFEHNVHNTVSI